MWIHILTYRYLRLGPWHTALIWEHLICVWPEPAHWMLPNLIESKIVHHSCSIDYRFRRDHMWNCIFFFTICQVIWVDMALSRSRILSWQDQRYGTRVHWQIGWLIRSSDNAQLELCTVLYGEAWAAMKDRGYKSLVLTFKIIKLSKYDRPVIVSVW